MEHFYSQIVSFYFDLFNLLGKGHLSWTTLVLSKLLPVTVLDVTFHVILCVLFGNDATIAQSGSDYSLGVKARVVLMHFTIIRHCFGCGLASCCSYSCVQFWDSLFRVFFVWNHITKLTYCGWKGSVQQCSWLCGGLVRRKDCLCSFLGLLFLASGT